MKKTFAGKHILRRNGFTLLEILVASSILSIIGAIVFGALNGVMSAGQGVMEKAELYQTTRFIVRKLTEDLHTASLFPNNKEGLFIGEDSGTRKDQSDKIKFTGFGRRQFFVSHGSDQAEIVWTAKKDSEGHVVALTRSENSHVVDLASFSSAGEEFIVTENLKSFNARYFAGGMWSDSFSSSHTNILPTAVEVNFTLEDKNGLRIKRNVIIAVREGP